MTKPIVFDCPRGKKKHNAYFHSVDNILCLEHGRLLYTEIPPELQRMTKFQSSTLKTINRRQAYIDKNVRQIGKVIAKRLKILEAQ